MTEQIEKLAAVLVGIAERHHKAFASTDGNDPMWALWYAKQLIANPTFGSLVPHSTEADELADRFAEFDVSFRKQKAEQSWQRYYARQLLEKQ